MLMCDMSVTMKTCEAIAYGSVPDRAGVSMSLGSEPAFALRCTVCEVLNDYAEEVYVAKGISGYKEEKGGESVNICDT